MVSIHWFGAVAQNGGSKKMTSTGQAAPPLAGVSKGRHLRSGQSGPAIAQLQMLLKQAGFSVKLDGKFGKQTQAAVRRFQQAHNCRIDGIVGPETLRAFRRTGQYEGNAAAGLRRRQNQSTGNTRSTKLLQSTPTRGSVSASELIANNNVSRAQANPNRSTAITPLSPGSASQTAQIQARVNYGQADVDARTNMKKSWRRIKNSRKWLGKCNAFAQRMMWAAGPKVKASAEAHRKTALDAELKQVREQAQSKAGPSELSRRQRHSLKKQERKIRRKYAPKNMHNYLPPLKEGGRKAHAGLTMTQLAENIKSGKGPQLRPGMTIHVKAFPHEKSPYGSTKRNPSNQTHHWFTYAGKDKQGNPQFMDSRGDKKTPKQCDRWLQGWMRGRIKNASSKNFGSYKAMRERLASEGKAYQDRNGNWQAKRGVQATIEAVYSPYKD
jgi:peptidoglycan hydrolase-like protein with peptidoglycan-binding domain